jgi:hypothetical protein
MLQFRDGLARIAEALKQRLSSHPPFLRINQTEILLVSYEILCV